MYKYWNIGWRPDGNLAVILGEAPGKVLVCQPASPTTFTINEITDLFRNPNAQPPVESADLYSILWNPDQSHFLLAGDKKQLVGLVDNEGHVLKIFQYSTNWILRFIGEVAQPPEQFTNEIEDSVAEIVWSPDGKYALTSGAHIYKANLNSQGVLEIPAAPIYDNTLAKMTYVQAGEKKEKSITGLLKGICWHSSKKYAIITGGKTADYIFSERDAWGKEMIPSEAIPKIQICVQPYHQLFIYDATNGQVLPVRFPLKNSPPLRRVVWRPNGGAEPFALSIIQYRH
jgi:WD40 repeat protein